MPISRISELLPISDEATDPHAYQILGLEPGEDDLSAIGVAIESTIDRLKAAKDSTAPDVWATAAKLVQAARVTLSDPHRKAQLDARFGIVNIEPEASDDSANDPLADVLPGGDPLAAMLPGHDPLAPANPASGPDTRSNDGNPTSRIGSDTVDTDEAFAPPSQLTTPDTTSASVVTHDSTSVANDASPVVVKAPRVVKRKSRAGGALLWLSVLGMFGLIGILGYVVFYGSGPITITTSEDGIDISAGPRAQPRKEDAVPYKDRVRPRRPSQRREDTVMEDLVGEPGPQGEASGIGGQEFRMNFDGADDQEYTPDSFPFTQTTEDTAASGFGMEVEASTALAMSENGNDSGMAEPMVGENAELTDEMVAKAEQAINNVRELIRTAAWSEMKVVAESVRGLSMNDSQKRIAETLFQFADLATYYRGGIELAVAELEVGTSLDVTETLQVAVVEKGEDRLVVKYSGRVKEFKFDEFPFSLAHRLASLQIQPSDTSLAAKAAFQAIAPKATDAHREESIDWLRSIEGEVDGGDPETIVKTIESLFELGS